MTCSNEIREQAKRASASRIVIFLEFDSISLYFTQISLNSLNFLIFSFSYLKFPWNSLNFWNSLKNSLRRSKFLRFRQNKENSMKVEALDDIDFWLYIAEECTVLWVEFLPGNFCIDKWGKAILLTFRLGAAFWAGGSILSWKAKKKMSSSIPSIPPWASTIKKAIFKESSRICGGGGARAPLLPSHPLPACHPSPNPPRWDYQYDNGMVSFLCLSGLPPSLRATCRFFGLCVAHSLEHSILLRVLHVNRVSLF